MTMTWGDALFLLPEIVLSIGACLLLLAPFMGGKQGGAARSSMLVLLAITAFAELRIHQLLRQPEHGDPLKASQLTPAEQKKAWQIARRAGKRMDEFGGPSMFGESWADMLESDLERSMDVTLRVRLNPDATLSVTGRWMEDGQFLHDYYAYLLGQAAEETGAKIGAYIL